MGSIPYIIRRRQRFYLRVRIPTDIRPLAGKDFLVKSLQTSDARRARGEAARLLAAVHDAWQEARRMVLYIPAPGSDRFELTEEDERALNVADLAALSAGERAEVTARLLRLLNRIVPGDPQVEAARARMDADKHHRNLHAATRGQIHMAAELAAAIRHVRQGEPSKATVTAPEARQPWNAQVERFFADRPSVGPAARTSYRQAFKELAGLIGKKPLAEVTRADVKGFADQLRDRPINRAGQKQMSRASIVKLLGHLKTYFSWAESAGFIDTDPANGVQPRTETRAERDGKASRRAFSKDELLRLFDSPLFTGCHSRSRRAVRGKQLHRDEPYWFFLISLLSGARTEEVAALPSVLVDLKGIPCLDYRHATKTSAGPRLVPVLPELRRLGLVEWAGEQARRGRGMVQGPNGYADWSKWLNRYLDDIGLDDPALVAYSLRHNFRQQLRSADLHPEIIDKIFGHEGESVGAAYGRDLAPDEARIIIERLKAPIPLNHLYPLAPLR